MSIDIPSVTNQARAASGPLYLATVVDTQGPCYRKIGGRLLVGSTGRLAGGVSGGCLERDLVRRIGWLTEAGPRVQTFDTAAEGDEEERSYLGCGGTLRVLLERADRRVLELLEWVAGRSGPCAIVTVLASDGGCPVGTSHAVTARERLFEPVWHGVCEPHVRACLAQRGHLLRELETQEGRLEVLVEYVPAPRRLLVAGRHYDTGPLVRLATECGWDVCVASEYTAEDVGLPRTRIDLSQGALRTWLQAHPDAAMVIMTHSVPLDRLALEAALRDGGLRYVGLLGPLDRSQKLLTAIQEQEPLPEGARACLKAPAGLDLGGEGAAAIALSIVAELEQVFARRIPKL